MARQFEQKIDGYRLEVATQGDYSIDEFLKLFTDIFDSDKTKKYAVVIRSNPAAASREPEDLEKIVETFTVYYDQIICLAYVTSSDFYYESAEQAAAYAELNGWKVKPFYDFDSANAWVDEILQELD